MDNEVPKLVLIDKPKGMSSFSVIRQLRRRTGIKKFGHAGTLDPLATGLLLLGVEKGTKLITGLVGLDKEYVAHILIGEKRATGDMEGEILEEREYEGDISEADVLKTLESLIGENDLPVSAYSAIKKDGVPMYKRARAAAAKGEVVDVVPRRIMKVYEVELFSVEEVKVNDKKRLQLKVRFAVNSGTYIRSLAEEVGRLLGYPSVMSDLRRTKVGEYKIENAAQLENITPENFHTLEAWEEETSDT